jgi:endonuclease YncB( thermonuclease family)
MNHNLDRSVEPESHGFRNRGLRYRCPALPQSYSGCALAGRASSGTAARRISIIIGLIALGFAAIGLPAVLAAGPPTGAAPQVPPSSGGLAPSIDEWLNQSVRLHETAQALDRPAADGKPAGEIRAGAEIKAIGLVTGGSWVQIELPNHALAYLPRSAIEFENSGTATGAPSEQQAPKPAGAASPRAAAAPATAAASAAGAVRGTVSKVPNAATLVVGDQRIRLSGIDPGPLAVLGPFEKWIEGQGALDCEPDAQTGRYQCLTGNGVDVAQAAILNGSGRVGDGAVPAYRDSETQARSARRGLWGLP